MYTLTLDVNEAILFDHVLSVQTWDEGMIDYAVERFRFLREQVGQVILEKEKTVILTERDRRELLVLVPILFQMGGVSVGLNIKKKLYALDQEEKTQIPEVFFDDKDTSPNSPEP